jgi:signal transduction histidine kinase
VIDPRWRTVLTVTPYIVLGMLVAFSLGVEWGQWSRLVPTIILCVLVAVWMLVMRTLPTPWRDRPASIVVFMVVLIGLNLALVLMNSWFGFLTVATFMFSYSIVEWPWQLLAVAATATVAGAAQSSSLWEHPGDLLGIVAVIVLNIAIMCGLSWGLELAGRQMSLAATAAERARLAREIHDTLAQNFAGIVTQLQAAEQASGEPGRKRHTDAALTLARDGLAEARRSVQALRPVELDAERLPDAVRNVARVWSARTGIPVDVRTSGDAATLHTDAEVALLRTAQEALANVAKHAGAHRVVLSLKADARGCRLEVRDDGRGFDPAERPLRAEHPEQGGYGLTAMRERIEAVAGSFAVDSHPGSGTLVRAEVPA